MELAEALEIVYELATRYPINPDAIDESFELQQEFARQQEAFEIVNLYRLHLTQLQDQK